MSFLARLRGLSARHVRGSVAPLSKLDEIKRAANAAAESLEKRLLFSLSAHVNFQPNGVFTPSGYQADTGAPYGSRGGGVSFGWDADNSTSPIDKDAHRSIDQRYDTYNLMQPGGFNRSWEFGVPNGSYTVHVVGGDPLDFAAVYSTSVEGTSAYNAAPTSGNRWLEGWVTVNVTDGKLTIANGAGASNNKINFVDIYSSDALPTIAAPSNLTATASTSGSIDLRWTDNSNNEQQFAIERKKGNGAWTAVDTVTDNVPWFTDTGRNANTTFKYRVRATNSAGVSAYSNEATATTLASDTLTPYLGAPVQLPGRIEAENFDAGGPGVSHSDNTTGNNLKGYRKASIDVGYRAAEYGNGGTAMLGGDQAGEWAKYSVNVPVAGTYHLTAAVSAMTQGGIFHIEFNGVDVSGPLDIPPTQTQQHVVTIGKDVNLSAGAQVMRIVFDQNAPNAGVVGNIDWVEFTRPGAPIAPALLTSTLISAQKIQLNWNDTSDNERQFEIQRATNSAFTQGVTSYYMLANVGEVATFTDSGVSPGVGYYYRVRALGSGGLSAFSNATSQTTQTSPFSEDRDIGSPQYPGAFFSNAGAYIVSGYGGDISGTSDKFHFVNRQLTGDATIIARVTSIENATATSKAGVMFRSSLAADSPMVLMSVTSGNGTSFRARSTTGGATTTNTDAGFTAPYWVKLVRAGNVFSAYRSPDGVTWTKQGANQTIAMGTTIYAGLAVASSSGSKMATGTFDNYSITAGAIPAAPTNLAATVGTSSIALAWQDNSSNESGFTVERATDQAFTQNVATAVVNANATSYTDGGVSVGTLYYYRVRATNSAGVSANSNIVTGQMLATVEAPTTNATTTTTFTLTAPTTGGTGLDYTWIVVGAPPNAPAVTFTDNGTPTAQTTTMTVGASGSYEVIVVPSGGLSFVGAAPVARGGWDDVIPELLTINPATAKLSPAGTQQFLALNQFQQPFADGTAIWSVDAGGLGSISATGLFTAPAFNVGSATVRAVAGSRNATASVTIAVAPTMAPTISLSVSATTYNSASLAWTVPTGSPPVASYELYRGSQLIGTTATLALTDSDLVPSMTYEYMVEAKSSGGTVIATSNTALATTAAGNTDTTPPSAPASVAASASSDSEIELHWAAAAQAEGVAGYEVFRQDSASGQQEPNYTLVGEVEGTYLKDEFLSPSTNYYYKIVALDTSGNESQPTIAAGTTRVDSTSPYFPKDPTITRVGENSFTLSWLPATDNSTVVQYNIYLNGTLATQTSSSTCNINHDADQPASVEVRAVDNQGNVGHSAILTLAANVHDPIDTSPDQYIPDSYTNYFYNTLTRSLRDRDAFVGYSTPPEAAEWADIGSDTFIAKDNIATIDVDTSNAYYYDRNGDRRYNEGESAWKGSLSHPTVIKGPIPPLGGATIELLPIINLKVNGVTQEKAILTDMTQLHGVQGRVAYRDQNGSGAWNGDEAIWDDQNSNSIYDGEGIDHLIYPGTSTLPAGTWGKTAGLNYAEVILEDQSTLPLVWNDSTVLRQDFAAFYDGLEAIIPGFRDPQQSETSGHDSWTLGRLMGTLGVPIVIGTGSITTELSDNGIPTGAITGAATHFASEIAVNESIKIGDTWFTVTSVASDTQLSVENDESLTAVSAASFEISGWTKVPHLQETTNSPGLSFVHGKPEVGNAVFPVQFSELYGVLAQLNEPLNRYSEFKGFKAARYDETSSATMISLVTDTLRAFRSLYGPETPRNPFLANNLVLLEASLENGGMGPDAPIRVDHILATRKLIEAIRGEIYVRGGSEATNGWRMPQYFNPVPSPATVAPSQAPLPLTFASEEELNERLPERNANGVTVRKTGEWSLDSKGEDVGYGSHVDPIHFQEALNYIEAISSNALWIYKGIAATSMPYQNESGQSIPFGGENEGSLPPWPQVPAGSDTWPAAEPSQIGPASISGSAILTSQLGYMYYSPVYVLGSGSADLDYADGQILANIPSDENPDGGNAVSELKTDVYGREYDADWAWGSTQVLASTTRSEVLSTLLQYYPLPEELLQGTSEDLVTRGPVYFHPNLSWHSDVSRKLDALAQSNGFERFVQAWLEAPVPVLFGKVPDTANVSHSPSFTTPSPLTLETPPRDELPLTTEMDRRNVIADTDLDDLVNIDHDQTTLGNDSGLIAFQSKRDAAQIYMPIDTRTGDNLPINAYIAQGGFGSENASVGDLLAEGWKNADADENGQPYAYSLDTRVRANLLIDDDSNHVKRFEVIRPRGNAVVFDFEWNQDAGEYAHTGLPTGWDARESRRLYVLRDLTPADAEDLNFELLFPTGIVHQFRSDGHLSAVRDSNGLSVSSSTLDPHATGMDVHAALPQSLTAPQMYDVKLNWSNGKLSQIDYATKGAGSETVQTHISYVPNSAEISALNKMNAGAAICQFSYNLSGATQIDHRGVHVERAGTVGAGDVTFTTTVDGVSGATHETVDFNGNGLITSDRMDNGDTQNAALTTYTYDFAATSDRAYTNSSPKWGQLTHVTYPDGSWTAYGYSPETGWLTSSQTPFKDGVGNDVVEQTFEYNDTSGHGDANDPTRLTERPRKVTTKLGGVQTSLEFVEYKGTSATTTYALDNGAAGSLQPGMKSRLDLKKFDSFDQRGPTGKLVVKNTPNSFQVTQSSLSGAVIQDSGGPLNAFGIATNSTSSGIGLPYMEDISIADAFGRVKTSTQSGGLVTQFNDYSWDGPGSVTAPDGTVTSYTYTPPGQVKTETVGGTTTAYTYDAQGNVETVTRSGGGLSVSTTTKHDILGRIISYTDEIGRETTYDYAPGANGTTLTTTYLANRSLADQRSNVDRFYLDGSPKSSSGDTVLPVTYDKGVEANGDVWTQTLSNQGANWTKTFVNVVGEAYKTIQTTANGTVAATMAYDSVGRVEQSTDFDGTHSFTKYDPRTGMPWVSVLDVDKNGVYSPNDRKSLVTYTASNTDSAGFAGGTTRIISAAGETTFTSQVKNGGLFQQDIANGLDSTSISEIAENGQSRVTTTNADGTKRVENYSQGLLSSVLNLSTTGSTVTSQTYGYDGLRRNNAITDPAWGTTTLTLRADGLITKTDFPDGRSSQTPEDQIDALTDAPKATVRTDQSTFNQDVNSRGQVTDISGAGQTPKHLAYDPNTGALTKLQTFKAGGLTGTPSNTIWHYQPQTGLLDEKTYDNGAKEVSHYNSQLQLAGFEALGSNGEQNLTIGGFNYNNAGELDAANFSDTLYHNNIAAATTGRDDQGRVTELKETSTTINGANSSAFTAAQSLRYDNFGRLTSDGGGAAGAAVKYDYYAATDNMSGADPGALRSMKVMMGSQILSETDYAYNAATKRLETVTVKGQGGQPDKVFTYGYKADTDLIDKVTTDHTTTIYDYEDHTGRLVGLATAATGGSAYAAGLTYTANDQQHVDSVSRRNPDGSVDSYSVAYGYDAQDQLTSVASTGTGGPASASWSYDQAGNRKTTGGAIRANNLNQYADYTYDDRGNCTFDGVFDYTYDAKDRLAAVEAVDHSVRQVFQYDAEGRRTEKSDCAWDTLANAWMTTPGNVVRYTYDGDHLIAEFDGSNHLLRTYAWGPTGLLGFTDYTNTSPQMYLTVADASGNVTSLTDAAGNVVASYRYDTWGNITYANAPGQEANLLALLWGQGYRDSETGLIYLLNRFYSPMQGRFLNRDPIAEEGGVNLYAYCGNDPVNAVDPSGTRFDTLGRIGQIAYEIGNVISHPMTGIPQLVMNHPAESVALVNAASRKGRETIEDSVYHPNSFQIGQGIGVLNAGAKMVTGPPQAEAQVDELLSRITFEAIDFPDREIDSFIANDAKINGLKLPDTLRERAHESTIRFAAVQGLDERALRNGSTVGEVEFNILLTGASFVDPSLLIGDVAEVSEGLELMELESRFATGRPWPITPTGARQVLDKSWKAKISGVAQKTGTPGHQFRSYREAILEAKKPNVQTVHLDHGYNRGLNLDPKTIAPNRRPDVLSFYDDRFVGRIEVQSKTDIPAVLQSRNAALDTQLRSRGFIPLPPRVVRPTSAVRPASTK